MATNASRVRLAVAGDQGYKQDPGYGNRAGFQRQILRQCDLCKRWKPVSEVPEHVLVNSGTTIRWCGCNVPDRPPLQQRFA